MHSAGKPCGAGVTPLEMDCRERREYAKQFQEKRSDNPPAAYGRGTHSQAESREAGANYI